jgi:hypothetical protein
MAEEINEEVIKDKRRPLRFFCIALELIGWILVFGGTMWFIYLLSGTRATSDRMVEIREMLTVIANFSFDFVFIGLVAVILAHLTRYVFERDFRRGILLRCGDKILYFFAVLALGWVGFSWFYYIKTIEEIYWRMLLAQPLILPTVAKALILVCLGQILKRILPVIEEYKSLV